MQAKRLPIMRQTADRGALQVDAQAQVAGSPVAWLLLENKGWGPILAEQQGRGSVREGAVQGEGVESFAGSTRSKRDQPEWESVRWGSRAARMEGQVWVWDPWEALQTMPVVSSGLIFAQFHQVICIPFQYHFICIKWGLPFLYWDNLSWAGCTVGQTDLPRRPDLNFPGAELDCRLLGCPLFVPAVPSGSGNTSLVLAYLSCSGNSKNLRVGGGPGDNAVGRSWGVKALLLKLNLQTKHTLSLLGFYVATF